MKFKSCFIVTLIALIIALTSSCSRLSRNQSFSDNVLLKGGQMGNQAWNSNLAFKRSSWFQETTMLFDAWLAVLDESSDFRKWLSKTELQAASSCQTFIVAMTHAHFRGEVSNAKFVDMMNQKGFKEVLIRDFGSHLKQHPDTGVWDIRKYKIKGFCSNNSILSIRAEFPGYKAKELLF